MMEHCLNYQRKMNKIVVWDHRLKPSLQEACSSSSDMSHLGNRNYMDFKMYSDDIRLIGTDDDIYDFCVKSKFQIQGSWKLATTKEHLKLYKENDNKLLMINLI